MKRYSFVIPVYQCKNLIKNTLETLNRLEGFPLDAIEVIVVDDGSKDGTGEVIKDMEKKYDFKYIYQERVAESSRSRARNTGINAAKGEIIIFLDGDMLLKHNYLEELDKYFVINNNIIVVGNRINLTEDVSFEEISANSYYGNQKFKLDSINKFEIRHLSYMESSYNAECQLYPWLKVYTCNLAVPKKYLDELGGFDENFKGWGIEDIELGYRLYMSGAKIIISNKIETFHQKHDKSGNLRISKDKFPEIDRNTEHFIKKHPNALQLPENVIIKFFRGQIVPKFSALTGIRKKVIINYNSTDNLEEVKAKILLLSKKKSLKIVVQDHVENTDLDIWIQLLGKQKSTPMYFPASKQLEVMNSLGAIGILTMRLVFARLNFMSIVLSLYENIFRSHKKRVLPENSKASVIRKS
ncbi:glycosyltransferase family 2 protein [Ruminiclostridium cellobioparum]|uniref:Family 2 glycosyl transferase n=1 Tax=Ruminiclostridium cellobioparum subsp. termitidis CT1112 TaxID=1195236 RepID=S0FTH7_RUMCE|nr:glycosyltransferase [Ruminiclostridium cellobioparum]EMS73636.1 family 2 glycosyl transferase [Ruminiclostridium cellobioparum subsp. termitidis CT1112]